MSILPIEAPAPRPGVEPMPQSAVHGPGRDRGFPIPQFFATVGGVRTAFADSGGSGPAVLFIHGLAGNVTHWVHVAPRFTHACRVLCIDLLGSGESDRPRIRYRIDDLVGQVVGLLELLGIQRTALVGHSMGGMVSAGVATQRPDLVSGLCLVNPAGMRPPPFPLRLGGRLLLRAALLDKLLPRIWKMGVLSNVFYRPNAHTERFIRTVESTYRPHDIHDISWQMDALRSDLLERDYGRLLADVEVDTHLIWGEKDRLVPARYLRHAAERLKSVHVEEIPLCGHMPNIERPERVVALLERVLGVTASPEV